MNFLLFCRIATFVYITLMNGIMAHLSTGTFKSLSSMKVLKTFTSMKSATSMALLSSRTVYAGDCRLEKAYSDAGLGKSTGAELADILVTDPPYCLLHRRRKNGDLRDPKIRQKKLDDSDTVTRFENLADYRRFTKEWLSTCISHGLKPGANLIIWTNSLGKQPIMTVCKEFGYSFTGEYLWAKRTSAATPSPLTTKNEVLLRVYESALVFQKESPTAKTVKASPTSPSGVCLPWSVITGYHENDSEQAHPHPCHKPFESLEPLIRAWTKPGELVLDVFAGSGGILCATAKIGGRRIRGIESLEEWAAKAEEAVQISSKPQII